jgi:hypothetical protein
MLGPDDRRTLTTLLTPPPGASLDAAIGTTYTLNLDAFMVVPALLTLTRLPPADEGLPTPLELLDSLRRTADKMTVFTQAGQIAVPTGSSGRSLFAFLERGTVPVAAPKDGVFHPKTWALRFRHENGRHTHRILVASRNLTFDRSWDAVIAMDEGEGGTPLRGYAEFLRALPGLALPGITTPEHRDRVDHVADTIATARFTPPPGYQSIRFHHLGLGTRSDERRLPTGVNRALVVSPFLTRRLLERIDVPWHQLTVVSRPLDLNAELDENLGCTAFQLKHDLVADDIDDIDDSDEPGGTGDRMRYPLLGLHAKLYVLDRGHRTTTLMGSANATTAAFNRNVEILLELEGSRAHTGVAKWLEPAANREQTRFRSLLEGHVWDTGTTEESLDEGESELDRLRRFIATVPVTAHVTEHDDTFTVRYTSEPYPPLPGVSIRARPLTLTGWHHVDAHAALDLTVPATLEGLTAFIVYEARIGKQVTEFVVPAELVGEPAHRRSRLIAQLLRDPDRLIRYLLLLLRDEIADRFPTSTSEQPPEGLRRRSGSGTPLESIPLLERFVRAASRSPETIAHVQQLFTDLESSQIVPAELRQLWAAVWQASAERSQP